MAQNSRMSGYLQIDNGGTEDLRFSEHGCVPDVVVGLNGADAASTPLGAARCASGALLAPPGSTRVPFRIDARYAVCTSVASSVTRSLPRCGTDRKPPPLPKGTYQVTVRLISGGIDSIGLPPPAAVTVDVV